MKNLKDIQSKTIIILNPLYLTINFQIWNSKEDYFYTSIFDIWNGPRWAGGPFRPTRRAATRYGPRTCYLQSRSGHSRSLDETPQRRRWRNTPLWSRHSRRRCAISAGSMRILTWWRHRHSPRPEDSCVRAGSPRSPRRWYSESLPHWHPPDWNGAAERWRAPLQRELKE